LVSRQGRGPAPAAGRPAIWLAWSPRVLPKADVGYDGAGLRFPWRLVVLAPGGVQQVREGLGGQVHRAVPGPPGGV